MSTISGKLKVSLIQADIFWEKIEKNLLHLTELLSEVEDKTDIVILPEMFSTGFSMQTSTLAEGFEGRTFAWMKEIAARKNYAVTGSFIFACGANFYNRLIWMNPTGEYYTYDKRHLFPIGGEKNYYVAGDSKVIIKYKNWKILPLICYDLRFPVWSRNVEEYDLLLYVANWPDVRSYAWNSLLKARAIENQTYVAAVNRVGLDGKGNNYLGESVILDPEGYPLNEIVKGKEAVVHGNIDLQKLKECRKNFPVSADADKFTILPETKKKIKKSG